MRPNRFIFRLGFKSNRYIVSLYWNSSKISKFCETRHDEAITNERVHRILYFALDLCNRFDFKYNFTLMTVLLCFCIGFGSRAFYTLYTLLAQMQHTSNVKMTHGGNGVTDGEDRAKGSISYFPFEPFG